MVTASAVVRERTTATRVSRDDRAFSSEVHRLRDELKEESAARRSWQAEASTLAQAVLDEASTSESNRSKVAQLRVQLGESKAREVGAQEALRSLQATIRTAGEKDQELVSLRRQVADLRSQLAVEREQSAQAQFDHDTALRTFMIRGAYRNSPDKYGLSQSSVDQRRASRDANEAVIDAKKRRKSRQSETPAVNASAGIGARKEAQTALVAAERDLVLEELEKLTEVSNALQQKVHVAERSEHPLIAGHSCSQSTAQRLTDRMQMPAGMALFAPQEIESCARRWRRKSTRVSWRRSTQQRPAHHRRHPWRCTYPLHAPVSSWCLNCL